MGGIFLHDGMYVKLIQLKSFQSDFDMLADGLALLGKFAEADNPASGI